MREAVRLKGCGTSSAVSRGDTDRRDRIHSRIDGECTMDDRSKRRFDLWALVIALGVVAVTTILAYPFDVLIHFRGSLLAYVGWLLLAGSALCGFLILGRGRSRTLAIVRNITFILGLVLVGLAIALNAYADNMFKWWPGS
jgi:hypothetical protein